MLRSHRSLYLNASVSAGALAIAVLAATPAIAANECGTPSGGVVHCDSTDAPFNGGINYDVDGDFTLDIEDGLSIAPDAGSTSPAKAWARLALRRAATSRSRSMT